MKVKIQRTERPGKPSFPGGPC